MNDFFGAHMWHLLQKVRFEVREGPTPHHFLQLFSTLHRSRSLRSMQEITLWPIGNGELTDVMHVVNPDAIRLLFAFPNLEVLQIKMATSFEDIDDALIKDITSTWPQLRSLKFQYLYTPDDIGIKVTIFGLLPLANCAFLASLSITLD